jgi:hypothetical protein
MTQKCHLLALAYATCTAIPVFAKTQVYVPDTNGFANPERGLYVQADISAGTLKSARDQGMSLIRVYYRLDDWRASALPAAFLNRLENEAALLRQGGMKAILRFS